MTRRALLTTVAGLLVWLPLVPVSPATAAPPEVEPAELTKRDELVGREVVVDDRVAYFQFHKEKGFDELLLKRTPVVFRLPPSLRPEHPPTAPAVRVHGVLQRQGSQWWCDVSSFEPMPSDLERLRQGLALLAPGDWERRSAWARWAERRGKEFSDRELRDRARGVEAESIRIEAEQPAADPPRHWQELAQRARAHQIPEPEPSALAHRGFQARRVQSLSAGQLEELTAQIEAFWPAARTPRPRAAALSDWEGPYSQKPDATYRSAPEPVRQALDHRLWADVTQRTLETQAAADPQNCLTLGDQAAQVLPDRPEVAAALWSRGIQTAIRNIGSLRKLDVERLASISRDRLHEPDRARDLYRLWLDDQRQHRLSPTDAEGRIALASQYDSLLGDQATAVALLRDAWKIDPESPELAQAFRVRGFRKVDGGWVESTRSDQPAVVAAAATNSEPPDPQRTNSLLHCTPHEVRQRLGGKPSRIVLSATQGQLIEQWIYTGATQNQYVNFLHRAGDPQPKVVTFYSLPAPSSRPLLQR